MKHGGASGGRLTEYNIWLGIRQRCRDGNSRNYPKYGARGITICDRWADDFAAFLSDMGPRPSLEHSVDRVDNAGHYEPGNCRWATRQEQGRNKRTNRTLTVDGRVMTVAEAAEATDTPHGTIRYRLERGWSDHDAYHGRPVIFPKARVRVFRGDGQEFESVTDAAKSVGVSPSSISAACSGARKTSGGYQWSREQFHTSKEPS